MSNSEPAKLRNPILPIRYRHPTTVLENNLVITKSKMSRDRVDWENGVLKSNEQRKTGGRRNSLDPECPSKAGADSLACSPQHC